MFFFSSIANKKIKSTVLFAISDTEDLSLKQQIQRIKCAEMLQLQIIVFSGR